MTHSAQTMAILVVDDSPVYRKLVEQTLEGEGYELLFAKSGEEALALYAKHQPPIVITDWMMPDFSGTELCKRIREMQTAYSYLILLTSNAEKANVVQGLAAGADDYLTKPFDSAEMIARIGVGRRLIGLQREIEAKNKQLELMARTDSLTGLPNRRAIEEWAEKQLRGAARHGYELWVVIADLDLFKSVNDNYGHGAGDTVLQEFAELLKTATRASDICGRLGGEEFVIVVTHVGKADIVPTIERVRTQLAGLVFRFGEKNARVTASFGVAGFSGKDAPDFEVLLRAADKALYKAKNAGRNRVELAVL